VREGHGDLRLEHVVVEEELEVVDCVEFDPALRTGDVALDLAFTLMGLHAINRRDLAQALVDAYREAGGDPGSDALVHGLAGCRALVRAKVAAIRADLLHAAGGERRAGLAEAGRLTALARRLFWRARLPLTIVVCGPAASGKTTLAAELARVSGLAHLSSDAIRKELEGVEPATPLPESGYSPQASARTYGELARRAREEAERGGGTLVDATFRLRRDRAAFREQLGEATGRLVVLSCQAAPELAAARAAGRLRDPATASDAGPERAIAQAREFEAFSEGWLARAITLPTDRPVAEVAARAEAAVDDQLAIT
jgi:predicted kinase